MTKEKAIKKLHFVLKKLIAFYIVSFYKPDRWYWIAYKITGFLVRFKWKSPQIKNRNCGFRHAYQLNSILSLLTRSKIKFPIPVKAKGFELFNKKKFGGLVLCSVHFPLNNVAVRYLIENGHKPKVAIASAHRKEKPVAIWGSTETIPSIPTGPFVLMKARTILMEGAMVVVLVDKDLGYSISPNIFLLAQKLKVDLLCYFSVLLPDGTIEVSFFEPSAVKPGQDANEGINIQIKELELYIQSILDRYEKVK